MKYAPAVLLRRYVLIANALALVIGLVVVVIATIVTREQVVPAVLTLVAGAVVQATVVTFVLGAVALVDLNAQVDSAVLRALQDVLGPVRDPIFAGSLAAYRWDCYMAAPSRDDAHPDYAYQNLRISYRVESLPAALQFMCAATRDDRVLENFTSHEYAFRWLVDDHLDVTNPLIFRVGTVSVDNQRLRSNSARTVDVLGGRARVLSYSVPRNVRQTVGHTVEFQVLVRKYIGDERRVRVQTQLFRSVTDAEFRMTVDPNLGVDRLFTAASEVSAIGVARGGSAESTFVEPFDQHAGIVSLPFPLQAGSSVAFTLDCVGNQTESG